MKNFKRIPCCLLAGSMLMLLAACGAQTTAPASTQAPAAPTEAPAASSAAAPEAAASEAAAAPAGGKTLVVYYSATGSTAAVAGTIADTLGADIFELTPAEPYTAEDLNWSDENSRVTREHEDETLRTVELTTATPESWADYDTVFIGYPIWWGIAAWPVDGFITANDFTGKTVIPFCTSASSGLGESGALLAAQAGTGDWLEGRRFAGGASDADVADWVNGLALNE